MMGVHTDHGKQFSFRYATDVNFTLKVNYTIIP